MDVGVRPREVCPRAVPGCSLPLPAPWLGAPAQDSQHPLKPECRLRAMLSAPSRHVCGHCKASSVWCHRGDGMSCTGVPRRMGCSQPHPWCDASCARLPSRCLSLPHTQMLRVQLSIHSPMGLPQGTAGCPPVGSPRDAPSKMTGLQLRLGGYSLYFLLLQPVLKKIIHSLLVNPFSLSKPASN